MWRTKISLAKSVITISVTHEQDRQPLKEWPSIDLVTYRPWETQKINSSGNNLDIFLAFYYVYLSVASTLWCNYGRKKFGETIWIGLKKSP